MRDIYLAAEMVRQPGQIPRCPHRLAPECAEMRPQAWKQAADEREKQENVDCGEPETGKDVEQLQLVEQWAKGWLGRNVLGHFLHVEISLRQHCSGECCQRQEEQEHERGTHRRQSAPVLAQHSNAFSDNQSREATDASSRGDTLCHIGNTTELTNSLRNQPMNTPHTPVTSARPTATSIIPPTI